MYKRKQAADMIGKDIRMINALSCLHKQDVGKPYNRVTQVGAADLCHVGHSGVGLGQAVQEAACCFQQGTGCVDIVVSEVIKQGLHYQTND